MSLNSVRPLLWKGDSEVREGVVLAIDPSLTSSGWAVGKNERDIAFGDLRNTLRGVERIQWIVHRIEDLLIEYKPATVVIEDYSFGSHTSAYDLGELGGFLRVLFHEYVAVREGAKFYKFSPNELKKFVTGKGNATKDMMMMKLLQRFGLETHNNNQADAAGLYFMILLGKTPAEKVKKKVKKVE